MRRSYCVRDDEDADCENCSFVNYRLDCCNNPIDGEEVKINEEVAIKEEVTVQTFTHVSTVEGEVTFYDEPVKIKGIPPKLTD